MNFINPPEKKKELRIADLIQEQSDVWSLRFYTRKRNVKTTINEVYIHRPGLALTGFVEKFSWPRIQIMGETEWTYLESLSRADRKKALELFFSYKVPIVIFAKGLKPPSELVRIADEKNVPVLGTPMDTSEILRQILLYLEAYFAFKTTMHGSLVDVYGVGMLYTGRAGIGKSECCLDLVERGHRLVADDIVHVVKQGNALVGSGNELIGHHMEIRGMGIIDVQSLFGIRAIRTEKKIEVLVELIEWTANLDYERIGIDEVTSEIIGIPVPKVTIPVSPGKNITVISEVIAMNMLLKMNGINSAKDFNVKLIQAMQKIKKERTEKITTIE